MSGLKHKVVLVLMLAFTFPMMSTCTTPVTLDCGTATCTL